MIVVSVHMSAPVCVCVCVCPYVCVCLCVNAALVLFDIFLKMLLESNGSDHSSSSFVATPSHSQTTLGSYAASAGAMVRRALTAVYSHIPGLASAVTSSGVAGGVAGGMAGGMVGWSGGSAAWGDGVLSKVVHSPPLAQYPPHLAPSPPPPFGHSSSPLDQVC